MTMVGLFTGAPQVTAASSATDDKQGAEGFGSALQDILSSLVAPPADASTEETPADTTEAGSTEAGSTEGADALSFVAAPPAGALPSVEIRPQMEVPQLVEPTLVELVERRTEPVEVTQPTNSLPLVAPAPLVETALSSSALSVEVDGLPVGEVSTSPGSSVNSAAATPTGPGSPLVELVEAPPSYSVASEETNVLPSAAGSRVGEAAPTGSVRRSTSAVSTSAVSTSERSSTVESNSTSGAGLIRGESLPGRAASTTPTGSATLPVELVVTPPRGSMLSETDTVPAAAGVRAGEVSTSLSSSTSGASSSTDVARSNRESVSTPILQPAAAPIGTPVPTGTVAPVAPTSAPAVSAASTPFAVQLAKPIFSLASAGTGEHVMTVSVTPDNLGPVTVRAHVGAEGVRVELFAPSDLGRDAIRAILPELRRDLAGTGLGGNLTLSAQDNPTEQFGAGEGGNPRGDSSRSTGVEPSQDPEGVLPERAQPRPGFFGTTSTIDVLA